MIEGMKRKDVVVVIETVSFDRYENHPVSYARAVFNNVSDAKTWINNQSGSDGWFEYVECPYITRYEETEKNER